MEKLTNLLNDKVQLTLKIIGTIIWVCAFFICFMPNWGGYSEYPYDSGIHRYHRVNFFDASVWIFGIIVIICSVVAVIVIWTKLYTILLASSAIQTLIVIMAYVSLENRPYHGGVYELGIAHLIMVILGLIISILFFIYSRNSEESVND